MKYQIYFDNDYDKWVVEIRQSSGWDLSADDAGEADTLAATGQPTVCIVPIDTPSKTTTPAGRPIIVCPAQTREDVTCQTCGLCARADRTVIIGFRAHGTRAKIADARSRRVIPIARSATVAA